MLFQCFHSTSNKNLNLISVLITCRRLYELSSFIAWSTAKMSHCGINWITIRKYVESADRIYKAKIVKPQNAICSLATFTSRSVLFVISKTPFAVKCIFVVISCREKLSKCLKEAPSRLAHESLCRARAIFLYSLVAEQHE